MFQFTWLLIILPLMFCEDQFVLFQSEQNILIRKQYFKAFDISEIPDNSTILVKVYLKADDRSSVFYQFFSIPICLISIYEYVLSSYTYSITYPHILKQNDRIEQHNVHFDQQAALTGNQIHLIQFKKPKENIIYMTAGDIYQKSQTYQMQFEFYYARKDISCTNNCQQTTVNGKIDDFICSAGTCFCGLRNFGSYCQLQKQIAVLDTINTVQLQNQSWIYFELPIDQLQISNDAFLNIIDLLSELSISFGYNDIEDFEVPTLHYDTFQINPGGRGKVDTYSLEVQLTKYQGLIKQANVDRKSLYIGLYNHQTEITNFKIQFKSSISGKLDAFLKKNYLLLIILGFNSLVAFGFICFQQSNRQRRNQENSPQERRRRVIRRRKSIKGFNTEFIDEHFKGYPYSQITFKYPAFREIEECVICLESLKEKPQQPPSPMMQERELMDICSITPCFHMFHQHCLKKWFKLQKYCPCCREKTKRWIVLTQCSTPVSNGILESFKRTKRNEYFSRMKQKSEINSSIQEDQEQLQDSVIVNSQFKLVHENDYNRNNVSQFDMSNYDIDNIPQLQRDSKKSQGTEPDEVEQNSEFILKQFNLEQEVNEQTQNHEESEKQQNEMPNDEQQKVQIHEKQTEDE